jgi:hypothetical protein
MSGPIMAFVQLRYRDAHLRDPRRSGTFSDVQDLGVEHLSDEPEVAYLDWMTRSVIDGHPGRQTICISTNEAIGTPSGPSRATSGKCRSPRPTSL